MSIWTLFKLLAAVCVLGVMAFTGMFAYHVTVAPLGGVFEKMVPNPAEVTGKQADADFAKMLDSAEMPDIDPGEKAFQKAHELLALGRLGEAREKLTAVVNVFPTSSSAPLARGIIGEINLDEILSTTHMEGKKVHVVKRGNSFFGIASQHNTTLDCIMHLNNMMELGNIQPGDELVIMPLDFRILIEPKRKSISLWDGGRFIREYPVVHFNIGNPTPSKTKISSKLADLDGRKIPPQSKEYRAAHKTIVIAKPAILIRGASAADEGTPSGITLQSPDMEEISLLTRVGNEVEIR